GSNAGILRCPANVCFTHPKKDSGPSDRHFISGQFQTLGRDQVIITNYENDGWLYSSGWSLKSCSVGGDKTRPGSCWFKRATTCRIDFGTHEFVRPAITLRIFMSC